MWNLKHSTNELTYDTETDSKTEREEWLPRGRRSRGEMDWELGLADAKYYM